MKTITDEFIYSKVATDLVNCCFFGVDAAIIIAIGFRPLMWLAAVACALLAAFEIFRAVLVIGTSVALTFSRWHRPTAMAWASNIVIALQAAFMTGLTLWLFVKLDVIVI